MSTTNAVRAEVELDSTDTGVGPISVELVNDEEMIRRSASYGPRVYAPTTHHLGFVRGLATFSWLFTRTALQAAWWFFCSTVRYLLYHPLHALSTALLMSVVLLLLITGSKIHDQIILSQISNDTVDRIIAASQFTRSYQSGEAGQVGADDFLRVGAPEWAQRESIRAILFHARRAGLSLNDQAILLATAEIESGFNPMAKAPSTTACGLFQFIRQTGASFGLDPTKCMDPWSNAQAGVQHYLSNYEHAVERSVSELTGPERIIRQFELSYYLHHDGPNSTRPSAELRALVLSGLPFLFRADAELQREAESQHRAPTFAQTFAGDVWHFLAPLLSRFSVISGAQAAESEQSAEGQPVGAREVVADSHGFVPSSASGVGPAGNSQ